MEKKAKNKKDTEAIAETFLREILEKNRSRKGAIVVGLTGDLGAGKTTFMQSIAKHLGVKRKVNSPTFVIMKKYKLPRPLLNPPLGRGGGYKFLFHLDAYRLKSEKELLYLGWEEIIANKEHLVFIEWPENVAKIMPTDSKFIHISHEAKEQRHFTLV